MKWTAKKMSILYSLLQWARRCPVIRYTLLPCSDYLVFLSVKMVTVFRLGDYQVINSCHDLAERHDKLQVGPRPIICRRLSQHA